MKFVGQVTSLEQLLRHFLVGISLLVLSLLCMVFYFAQASALVIVTSMVLTSVPFAFACWYCTRAALSPFYNLSVMIEAMRQEDYSQRANPRFIQGAVSLLNNEIALMAQDLQTRKNQYDQQAVLVLRLIEQLATPIGLFDAEGRLQHANEAFSKWCHKPWRSMKRSQAELFGLFFTAKQVGNEYLADWRFADVTLSAKWQLRHSQFVMQGQQYQLVVLTNIEQVVYQTEQTAWHKMTKVLSHEINNSLAPIKSLAQSLEHMLAAQQQEADVLQALCVIGERSESLMKFVNRYASLATDYDVHLAPVNLVECLETVTTLFDYPIDTQLNAEFVSADKVLLEQVMVNLLKNAIEASKGNAKIIISVVPKGPWVEITVLDNGCGIANPDNLFVPFYTTKSQGKGIGLTLCRNMIEQQGGKLSVSNRKDVTGVKATVLLEAANA